MTETHIHPPVVVRPGDGTPIPGPEGITLKLTREQSGGAIGVLEAVSEPGFDAPRHVHRVHDELFYVLGGEFLFLVGDELVSAPAGTLVFVPRGTVHAPKVVSDEPGKVLVAYTPGGQEGAFVEFAALAAEGQVDIADARFAEVLERYESEVVGPPI
ncbi:MAG: cupin domain-containing protein [Actinomycetes bacterium]|jgi:quercetin dioxygenase-like cupin family protein|nr:cupin domain-containing protein [Acidimicrobiia bacterium]